KSRAARPSDCLQLFEGGADLVGAGVGLQHLDELGHAPVKLLVHRLKGRFDLRLGAADLGRVRHAPVALDGTAQKYRAGFAGGFVADGDDDVGRDRFELIPGFAVEPVGGDAVAAQL